MQKACDSLEGYVLEHLDKHKANELEWLIRTEYLKEVRKSEYSHAKQVDFVIFMEEIIYWILLTLLELEHLLLLHTNLQQCAYFQC